MPDDPEQLDRIEEKVDLVLRALKAVLSLMALLAVGWIITIFSVVFGKIIVTLGLVAWATWWISEYLDKRKSRKA